ncbi:MAG: chromosome partitioning protein ParB [Bacteroidales bacterium]|nr:chromosome partitioning protein ParB [Bacteroidales bacterium]
MEIKQISIGKIKPSPMNPRKTFNEEDINELANNIESQGLLQPITVRPIEFTDELDEDTGAVVSFPTSYELVCGERRFRAVSLLKAKEDEANIEKVKNHRKKLDKWQSIACIVREMNDEEAFDAMITENLQRKDVDPIEEAFAFAQLIKKGDKVEDIALRFGKSNRFVLDRVKLNSLIPELLLMVKDGKMVISAGMIISKLEEEQQQKFLKDITNRYHYGNDIIGKAEAQRYIDRLFLSIENSEWVGDGVDDFKGSCECSCSECAFNTANHGCLFYEMNSENPQCTNRDKFLHKERDYFMSIIEKEVDNLIKSGETLTTGKTVVAAHLDQYASVEYQPQFHKLVDEIKAKGISVIEPFEVFDRYSSYDKADKRLKEKLAKNEVYRVFHIECNYYGVSMNEKYFSFKKDIEAVSDETLKESQEVNTLVAKYKRNIEIAQEKQVAELRKMANELGMAKRKGDISDAEQLAIDVLILSKCGYKFKDKFGFRGTDDKGMIDFVRNNQADRNMWYREFMREIFGSSDITFNKTYQYLMYQVMGEWLPKESSELGAKTIKELDRKNDKIKAKLEELGYDVHGKKLA